MKYFELQSGMTVYLDDSFTCHHPGPIVVEQNQDGLFYFECSDGIHLLDGNIDIKTQELIGVSLNKPKEKNHMTRYIGTKTLMAVPITLGDYNQHRGWTIPDNKDPLETGYLVEDETGRESYIPDAQFESTYKSDGQFDFGHAMFLLKQGARVSRAGWNGKKMFLFIVAASNNLTVNREPLLSILGEGAKFNYQSHVDMFTADGTIVPWLCSQTDMQAEDWGIVPDA